MNPENRSLQKRCGTGTNQGESWWACDIQVNEGCTNELKPHENGSQHEDKMTKRCLKELKVTTYSNMIGNQSLDN